MAPLTSEACQGGTSDSDAAHLRIACGRIVGGARAIGQALQVNSGAGADAMPWSWDYHRKAVHVYAESLSLPYQLDVESLFGHCAKVMNYGTIPAALAADWAIVRQYLLNAAASIGLILDQATPSSPLGAGLRMQWDENPPPVVRYDRLARMTCAEGIARLEKAAIAVRDYASRNSDLQLDVRQRKLLIGIVAGTSIADLAVKFGYSQRSMYRELSKLWEVLGVPNRHEGIRRAIRNHLVD